MGLVLVLGGTRSGKSAVAERLAGATGRPVRYLATGTAIDAEMAERIAAHQARRPPDWRTIEVRDPAAEIAAAGEETVLLDGLGAWIAARMHEAGLLTSGHPAKIRGLTERIREDVRALAAIAVERRGETIVVAEESGLGPTPPGAATRCYLDLAGEAAQALAERAERVLLVVAGRALELPAGEPPPAAPAAGPTSATQLPAVAASAAVSPVAAPPGAMDGLRLHGDRMVPPGAEDFAVNVVEDGPPSWLRAALVAAVDASDRYPVEDDAVAAIAARHGRPPAEVLPLAGAAEAFWLLAATLTPRNAACAIPGFTESEAALRAFGHPVEHVPRDPERDLALDPARIPDGADFVVLGNPNNPTGTLDPADRIASLARPDRVVVVDEAFADLVPSEPESLAGARDIPGLVVVRSLTKAFAIPGIRAGYLLGPAPLLAALRARRPPWPVSAPALAALRACAERPDAAADIAARIADRRTTLTDGLARLPGVRVWPAAANFVLVHVPDGLRVLDRLRRDGIAVRPCGTFPGLDDDHLRIAVRRPDATARLLAALERALR